MMQVNGRITTRHRNAACVAAALRPDNLSNLTTTAGGDHVTTTITGTQIRTIIASVDDYLMNLAIADDACSVSPKRQRISRSDDRERTVTEENSGY
jgi:hypothetical protein